MSPFRPDLIECWVFRLPASGQVEFLLVRRSSGRIFPGLWQCVTGGLEPGERVPIAALREVFEEVGLGPPEIEAFYDLDQVTQFYDEGPDGVVTAATFAVRVHPDAVMRLSDEHDDGRWVAADDALGLVVWPAYAATIRRILATLTDAAAAPWFELTLDGHRIAR